MSVGKMAVMGDPSLAHQLPDELPVSKTMDERGVGLTAPTRPVGSACKAKGVGGRAEGNDRFAGREEVEDVLKGLLVGAAKSQEQHHQIGVGQFLGAGQRLGSIRIHKAVLIDGEADGYVEVEVASEDAGEHRHGFFGAIFFIASEEYDLGFGGFVLGEKRGGGDGRREEQNEEFGHGFQRTQMSGLTQEGVG